MGSEVAKVKRVDDWTLPVRGVKRCSHCGAVVANVTRHWRAEIDWLPEAVVTEPAPAARRKPRLKIK
jgi:hypothetical protein